MDGQIHLLWVSKDDLVLLYTSYRLTVVKFTVILTKEYNICLLFVIHTLIIMQSTTTQCQKQIIVKSVLLSRNSYLNIGREEEMIFMKYGLCILPLGKIKILHYKNSGITRTRGSVKSIRNALVQRSFPGNVSFVCKEYISPGESSRNVLYVRPL